MSEESVGGEAGVRNKEVGPEIYARGRSSPSLRQASIRAGGDRVSWEGADGTSFMFRGGENGISGGDQKKPEVESRGEGLNWSYLEEKEEAFSLN